MKTILFTLSLLVIISCNDNANVDQNNDYQKLKVSESTGSEKESLIQWTNDYLDAVNSPDWKTEILAFLPAGASRNNFIKEHSAFRSSFQNFKLTAKHIMVDKNEVLVWMKVKAKYAEPYTYNNGPDNYGDQVLNGTTANNQKLTWDETWYFNVVNGQFGRKWDFYKDHFSVLKGIGALE